MLTYSELKEMANWYYARMMDWYETGHEVHRDQTAYEFTWEWRESLDEIEIMVDWFETLYTMTQARLDELAEMYI